MDAAFLCVDDDAVVLSALKEQLRRNFGDRYAYETAQDADDAWIAMEDLVSEGIEIVVIVSDWLMPGTKGDEFLTQVYCRFPSVITVLLTGQADSDAIERAQRDANLHACLQKPWSEQELMDVLVRSLAR